MDHAVFERKLENHPLRNLVRELFEIRGLKKFTGIESVGRVLYYPSGNGKAAGLLRRYFAPSFISAIDRDHELIAQAQALSGEADAEYEPGSPLSLRWADGSFDTVFDLDELHNLREWRTGLSEARRVLKPGGLFIAEELSIDSFTHGSGRIFRKLTDHPYDEMFTPEEFRDCVAESGFELLGFKKKNTLGLLRYFWLMARAVERA